MNLIEGINLSKCYDLKAKNKIYAVNNINLAIEKGEIIGLIGESGCGKSTLAKMLLKLEKATNGKVIFKGEDITNYSFNQIRLIRKDMQMIFQNSLDLFNPYFTVREVIQEPLNNFVKISDEQKEDMIISILEKVGLDKTYLSRYANELSGGQRQRVGIARALILNPEFVICDEPTSSVDYAIRNQILDLLLDLKNQFQLTYLFISHDISTVHKICDKVIVMYLGNIVEIIPNMNEQVIHPYSKDLMDATLDINPRKREYKKVSLYKNEDNIYPKKGCIFQNRCPHTKEVCRINTPILKQVGNKDENHYVACHIKLK